MARVYLCVGLLLVLLLAACGDDDNDPVGPEDDLSTVLTSVTPADGAVDVNLLQGFTFQFNTALDPATLDAATVTTGTRDGGLHIIPAADSLSLWVAPDSLWAPETTRQIVIAGATDATGTLVDTMTVSFTTGALNCTNLADRFEDNDTPAEAATCPLDTDLFALSFCDDDNDVFVFTLDDTAMVTARAQIIYANGTSWSYNWTRADERYYGGTGMTLASGQIVTDHYSFLPGTYYLKIQETSHVDHILYNLRLETGTACPDDIYEDNDFEDTAYPLAAGLYEDLRGCVLDADWFSVEVDAGQTITLTVTTEPYGGFDNRRLRIREPGGAIATYNGSDEPATLTNVATSAGTATVMARFWADDVVYDLDIAVTGP